ncbi:MAG: FAD-dependent oxidoreductase [Nitrospinae bacterium]|nr:FAD-dependent oxidoreductase [Nitrospinota bacterium]
MGKRIVILGSSFGGLNTALHLRKLLGNGHSITVVSADPQFTFIPSLPWVVAGRREPSAIQCPVAPRLKRNGVEYVQDAITAVDPERQEAVGKNGVYPYDYLVAATGSELDFGAVSGLGPIKGHSQSIFNVEQALQARAALEKLLRAGSGTIVLGNAQGASCLGPVYEMALLIDALLRKRKARHKFKMALFTNEPHLGHFGVGGFGAMTRMLEDEFADREIECHLNSKISGITPDHVELENGVRFGNGFSLIVPAFFGSHAYMGIEGLANPRGFVLADDHLANPKYPNIYAVGVSLAIAPPAPTPVPVGVPKTGQMTDDMAKKAAYNISADIQNRPKIMGKDFSVTCIADGGNTAFFIGAAPLLPPRDWLIHKKSILFHYLKEGLEKYYMASVRYGLPLPTFPF